MSLGQHLWLCRDVAVEDVTGEYGARGDETQGVLGEPLPEDHWLVQGEGLQLGFGLQVEDLDDGAVGTHRDHVLGRVHDRGVTAHVLPGDLVPVRQVDDGHGVRAIDSLPNGHVVVTFECS